ncbi:aliphatic sulfonate ABC transporter substrate-binding protein [Paenibacillus gansuensis]|uniref:Aliphatic sulfonate ABC transporter substrate-binding protein n=1 Tax=Paenibacillus gansuensis TaxID=306542 RepID=A0ABW5PC05_9BACL
MKRNFRLFTAAAAAVLLLTALAGCSSTEDKAEAANSGGKAENTPKKTVTVNIGYQGVGLLNLQQKKGWLEDAFAKAGAKVQWQEFPSGPPHFEAIASDRLDFGLVGNGPVIAGQAGGVGFKEIAVLGDGKLGDTLLVHKDSGIAKVADLKGKKVAVAKGSSAYTFVYRAAVQAGLEPSEIDLIQLQPDEAQAAFQSKAVDAWAIWEPYVSLAEKQGAVVLANGKQLNLASPSFAVVRSKFAEEHPELVTLFLSEYKKALDWQKENTEEVITLYSELKKVEPDIIRNLLKKQNPILEPVSDIYLKAQQETADLLYDTGGIKKKIDVKEVVDNTFVNKLLEN